MSYLLVVSIIWAFSFGLIKNQLSDLDPNFVSFARMFISFAVFIPFLRLKGMEGRFVLKLVSLGALQYGAMYIAYIYSYQFLQAHQVALFTIFTPLYVTLTGDLAARRLHRLFLLSALLAVLGMGIVVYRGIDQGALLTGFVLVQVSNLCFAAGQVFYKRMMSARKDIKDARIFALLYLGAVIITALSAGISTPWKSLHIGTDQALTLLYLGVLASGVCFFLWNYGAKKTNIGALAVMNNLKVPLAVAFSMLFFGEQGNIPRLVLGGAVIAAALFINETILRKRQHRMNAAGRPFEKKHDC